MTRKARRELELWFTYIDRFNGRAIAQAYPPRFIEMNAATDAGETRVGGYIQLPTDVSPEVRAQVVEAIKSSGATRAVARDVESRLEDGIDVSYIMKPEERARSSTWRELLAVLCILQCFAAMLVGLTVRLYVDNMGTAVSLGGKVQGRSKKGGLISFVEKFYGGSKHEDNQDVVEKIVDLAVEHNFYVDAQWVPRDENERADASTHITAIHDFKLRAEAFQRIEDRWGEHTIDRFACSMNVLVPNGKYNSRFLEPGMENCRGIDALAQHDWHLHNNYAHPPYTLLAPTIHTIRRTGARATLVFPAWKSKPFWPLLRTPDGRSWAADVKEVMYLGMTVDREDASRDLLIPVGEGSCRSQLPHGHLYAVRIEPVEGGSTPHPVPRAPWQGKWWLPRPKRTRPENLEEEPRSAINRRYRRQQDSSAH